ncbi:type VI secretion system Vgr family protein [Aquimarina aquimarini]|uniref:type VI secretion system Vgr family protein n=1 Tax=Aquimarina aquimarini TaxID=1191734 RepID=UPI00131F27F2|nr:phage baseplate assembly protein V [Aquimarina aquimarini]
MALQSQIQIFIGGAPIKAFKTFNLFQEIDSHHDFELICRTDILENGSEELASQTKNFLGEIFILQVEAFGVSGGYKELEFKGVVTSVNVKKGHRHSDTDNVIISGKSSSVIADDGPHYSSYNDTGLSEILTQTFQGYDISKLETAFTPVKSTPLHYSVQQNESSYEYASRLAAQYSEWFYYDGKKLIFGNTDYKTIPLQYGFDLQEFSLELAPKPNKYKYFTNDYITDQQHEKSTSEVDTGVNGFNQFTSEKSNTLYAKETAVYINSYDDPQLKQRLDTHVEQQKKAVEVKQVILRGKSDNPGVHLGDVVTIQDGVMSYGSFRITKVSHHAIENGKYVNKFEGVTADIDVYPNTNMMAFPKSEAQVASVVENVDPQGISRIRVQFPWQKPLGEITPWLRVVAPHAGGEKGFHFIPEKGEEVLIGFEGGNAERPYVIGSLYTGGAHPSGFQSDANDIKAIQSRSGTKMIMNDKVGSMLLTDKGTASMMMDGGGNTKMATNTSHTTSVGEDSSVLKMDADGNIDLTGKEKLTITIGESSISMLKDGTVKIQGKAITVEGDDIGVGAHKSTAIFSPSNHIAGNTKMDGGDVFIN